MHDQLKPLNEDHLLVVIDYFIDFANNVFLLGYDLRIDAYSYCKFPMHFQFDDLQYNSICRIQKNSIESKAVNSYYQLDTISPHNLNPIEEIYYTNYKKKLNSLLADASENPMQLKILLGTILQTTSVDSLIGKCLDLTITNPTLKNPIITRTQDASFKENDTVAFLMKLIPSSQGDTYNILGLKPKHEIKDYLNPEFLNLKNRQIKWVDYR